MAGEVFGTAPRAGEGRHAPAGSGDGAGHRRRVEAQVDELAAPGGEAELREAVLRYTREIAFGTAQVYARTAEARGAWDARLEALVVESLVRGEVDVGPAVLGVGTELVLQPGHRDRRHRRGSNAAGAGARD